MINEKTVLILGAGASKPYGFSIGIDLLKEIIFSLDSKFGKETIELFLSNGFSQNEINDFKESLQYSSINSVDTFLERRPEFIKIGKFALAQRLVRYENPDQLFNTLGIENSWYVYLFNKMICDFESFQNNQISFITFNYDRSLEHFLLISLKNMSGCDENICIDKLKNIPIIHVHGQLGLLPWQGNNCREYKSANSLEEINMASEQIQIISENIDNYPLFQTAYELLIQANNIYFLGFGYNERNMIRLKLNNIVGKKVLGTGFNLGEANRNQIVSTWSKLGLLVTIYDINGFFREVQGLR